MQIQAGDILLYRRLDRGEKPEAVVDAGQLLEDGLQPREYDHAAIAMDADRKIESNTSKVEIVPLSDGGFDVYRLPFTERQIQTGLTAALQLVGQAYDWWLIADEVLRDLSDNMIHFDESFINGKEETEKICSTLVSYFFLRAGWGNGRAWPKPSPEDIWLAVRDYEIVDPC